MSEHLAIVTPAARASLKAINVPTVTPINREVRVHVEWTASTPLDMHQAEGGLLVKHPQVLGDGIAGTVVEIGPEAKNLKVGDKVFGFGWRERKEKAFQEFATLPEFLLAKLPEGFTLQEAVTLPNNFVTVFHAVTTDLGIALPWPRPDTAPSGADQPILIWGGSSSVGLYAIQILRYYGYRNVLATASKQHHQHLQELGASAVFDYRSPSVVEDILNYAKTVSNRRTVPYILDCIGSKYASVAPSSKIAQSGSKVAVLLPIIVKDASDTEAPEYEMDVTTSASWASGVDVRGVRTHFYLDNELFREHLQPTIMPKLLVEGVVKPNRQRIIEGATMLERAQKALDALRRKEPSGERLVWRVADN